MSNEVQVAQNTQVVLPQHLAALFAGKSTNRVVFIKQQA